MKTISVVSGRVKSGKSRYVIGEYVYPALKEGKTVYYLGEYSAKCLQNLILGCYKHKERRRMTVDEVVKIITGDLVYISSIEQLPKQIEDAVVVLDNPLEGKGIEDIEFINCKVIRTEQLALQDSTDGVYDDGKLIVFNPADWSTI